MILKLTNGTASLNFQWNSVSNRNFILKRGAWQPRASRRRRSQLGGRSPYEDVVEEIGLYIAGDTEATLLSNQASLIALLDQAEQWEAGAPVTAVLLQYGLSDDVYEAAVLGPADGDESALGLTTNFNHEFNTFVAEIRLRVKRRGLWTLPPRVTNYLANWSFESDNSTTPGGWSTTAIAPGVTAMGAPLATVQHGINHRSVQNTNAGGTAILYQDVTGLTVGASYRVSAYAYRSAGAGNARLTAYDGGGVTNAVTATTTAAAYTRIEVTKVCPAGGSIRVALEATGSTTGVFDAVLLETLPASGSASPLASIDAVRSNRLSSANVLLAMFGESVAIPSPIRAVLTRTDASGAEQQLTFYPCVWALTNSWSPAASSSVVPNHIGVVNMSGMSGGGVGQYTSVAASATLSRGGNVLRYTPTTTAEVKVSLSSVLDTGVLSGAPVVFVTVQASVTNQFTVRGYIGTVVGASDFIPNAIVSDPVTVIGTGRQVIALRFPEVLANINLSGAKFRISVQSTAAAGTCDFDTATHVASDQHPDIVLNAASGYGVMNPSETVIASYLDSALNVTAGLMGSANYRMCIDPRVVTAADGLVGVSREDGGWDASLSYLGTADLYMSGDRIASVWIAPDSTNWRFAVSGPAAMENQLIVTRRKAALVPQ